MEEKTSPLNFLVQVLENRDYVMHFWDISKSPGMGVGRDTLPFPTGSCVVLPVNRLWNQHSVSQFFFIGKKWTMITEQRMSEPHV